MDGKHIRTLLQEGYSDSNYVDESDSDCRDHVEVPLAS